MPPTRTRAATSAAVRPVRIATARGPGRAAATRASRRSARRASGTMAAAPGSREPSASVPSKSHTTSSGPGADARPAIAPIGRVGQDVTSTPGRKVARSIVPSPAACGTTNGGAGSPTWNGAAAALGVTEAAADGLALGGDRRRRPTGSCRRDRERRVGRRRRRRLGGEREESPRASALRQRLRR